VRVGGAKGGARQQPSQGGRRGTLAAGGARGIFFFLCTRWVAMRREGESGPGGLKGAGIHEVGEKKNSSLAEMLSKL
jgi:hypothetical protein